MRKFIIGFMSLGVVLAAYLFYSGVSDTPVIDPGPGADFMEAAVDSNIGRFDGEIGKIEGVGIGTTRNAYYINTNEETNAIEREWGFEILLHAARDVWELQKPYVNIYRRNFKCYITADKGQMQVETAVGRTTPKDATLSENVIIHIVPEGSSSIKESFIYLGDITFLSDRSQLSTAGPVRFVSEDVKMRGIGLELIYNEQDQRLEFFRIVDLESLRIRSSQMDMFSTGKTEAEVPAEADAQAETRQPGRTPVAAAPEETEALPPDTQPQIEQEQGEYYKCILSKNVIIDTVEQLVFADERICINEIFWSKTSSDKSDDVEAAGADDAKTVAATTEKGQDSKADSVSADSAVKQDVTVAEPREPNELSEQFVDVVVTSDNGLVFVPMDTTRALDSYTKPRIEADGSDSERPEALDDDTGRTRFFARRIDYSATSGDVIADGLSEVTFYTSNAAGAEANEPPVEMKVTAREVKFSKASNQVICKGDCLFTMPQPGLTAQKDVKLWSPEITVNLPEDKSKQPDVFAAGPVKLVFHMEDPNAADTVEEPVPVTVTAQKYARFSAASNQIVFEDDCRCIALQEDPNVLVTNMLLSERMTVDLLEDANDRSSGPAADIRHLTASGGVVRLVTTKTAKPGGSFAEQVQYASSEELLGGVELKCRKFDYDADGPLFLATGPGEIRLNNAGASEPNEQVGRLSLSRPCYGLVENFDTLKYFFEKNLVVADAKTGKMNIGYIPIIDGEYGQPVKATASHLEAFFCQTPEGQTELLTLTATGGIDYNDPDEDHHFVGSGLFYDHKTSIVKVWGDESRPCYYNGALVDGIKLNLATGDAKFEIVAPSTLQTNR
jgi:hypothetical protein